LTNLAAALTQGALQQASSGCLSMEITPTARGRARGKRGPAIAVRPCLPARRRDNGHRWESLARGHANDGRVP
jgi:hypothetical protein